MNIPTIEDIEEILGDSRAFKRFLKGERYYGRKTAKLPKEEQTKRFMLSRLSIYTQFFRDGVVLNEFKNTVLPSCPDNKIVRVASVGCSTGEEPYSLLLDNWDQRKRLQIDAYDLMPGNIEEATSGVYIYKGHPLGEYGCFENLKMKNPEEAFRVTKVKLKDGYWHKIEFTDEAKSRIQFQPHNIVKEPLSHGYDVVLLLNMLYHFSSKIRKKTLSNIYESMNESGWLLCEVMGWTSEEYIRWMEDIKKLGFKRQSQAYRFYRKKH